ncbi:MAG: 2-oxo acid dehydrogenase subunit E2 [Chloroflexi bacterium]|jgi:pyruvate/2-oxoglutarate dehydrogenase complex dihydrolipoamide acyltransferase (E2) component|nr:2-oxo acid dehydrogenase subunit E2 [Chloroflexota bacterium]MBT3670557.1 2-oxo acid dehydrogenase subunit E2 [Chloroflexota bacterium]MBT4002383.1 2-oxo acid dehydrogenase subunit E2 [Chloroflexota bacterium]MBT4304192.1 2-oxo acid dehydrogenase subunit E2 [Chloroflexota bacterium]MBT4533449.1 2-oxo acid dehydrogenase subunit E2 [Chloroflexota bacterium]
MATQVIMPEMGEGVTEATIIRWLKKEGDAIDEYEGLVEINTDKVDSEVPSPISGIVLKIMHAPDSLIEVNQVLAWIGKKGEEIPDVPDSAPAAKPVQAPTQPKTQQEPPKPVLQKPTSSPSSSSGSWLKGVVSPLAAKLAAAHGIQPSQVVGTGNGGQITQWDIRQFISSGGANATQQSSAQMPTKQNAFISPIVAKLAAENNINLLMVAGTGKEGRITKKDIQRVIEAGGVDTIASQITGQPEPTTEETYGGLEAGTVMKLNPVRRSIAKHMVESLKTSPHVSTFMDIDMSRVAEDRNKNKSAYTNQNVHLTFTAYFISAIAQALKTYPIVNSSWSEEGVKFHKDINIGVAVSLDTEGLIVPVIKNVGEMTLLSIARSINDLSTRAREKNLRPDEVRGGTFTITNHGTSGSIFANPIINQPQCGILGTGMIEKRAVVIDDAIAIRPMVTVGLTFDHRILDGAVGDYFLGNIKKKLETW